MSGPWQCYLKNQHLIKVQLIYYPYKRTKGVDPKRLNRLSTKSKDPKPPNVESTNKPLIPPIKLFVPTHPVKPQTRVFLAGLSEIHLNSSQSTSEIVIPFLLWLSTEYFGPTNTRPDNWYSKLGKSLAASWIWRQRGVRVPVNPLLWSLVPAAAILSGVDLVREYCYLSLLL